MSDAQEPHDMYDPSIPLLTEILVSGDPARARSAPPMALSVQEAPLVADAPPVPEAPVVADALPVPDAPAVAAEGAAPLAQAGMEAYEADALVERLRGRCLTWLAGEGRTVVESRCRAALHEHSDWLVGQITREVGLALETELAGWVRDAMRDEAAARASRPPFNGA